MFTTYSYQQKQQGITLVELMLSLVIIAVLLVAVGRYYESTRSAQRINEGVKTVFIIKAAAEQWFMNYKTFRIDSDEQQSKEINLTELYKQGLLPGNFKAGSASNPNPWGGSIEVKPDSNDSSKAISIQLTGINKKDCLSFCEILSKSNIKPNSGDSVSDCSTACSSGEGNGVTYKGIYSTHNTN